MRSVLGGDLDSRNGADVEARFVEHHDDVRRLRHRRTRFVCGGAEPSSHLGVGFEHAARDEVADRGDAGTHEFRDVVLPVPLVPGVARHRQREPDEAREAGRDADQRAAEPDTERVEMPDQHQREQHHRRAEPHPGTEVREYVQQERDGVEVDHHDVHEVRRHQQHVVLEARQQDQNDDQSERQRRCRGGTAQHAEPAEVQEPPGEQECRPRHDIDLRRHHDGGGRGVKRDDEGAGGKPVGARRVEKSIRQRRNRGRHGGRVRARD